MNRLLDSSIPAGYMRLLDWCIRERLPYDRANEAARRGSLPGAKQLMKFWIVLRTTSASQCDMSPKVEFERKQLVRELAAVKAERERLVAAIRWALGEGHDFPARPDGAGPYWWRTELRRLTGLGNA